MEKIMTYETLGFYTYSNGKLCKKLIKGFVIDFFGLNGMDMFDRSDEGELLAKQGILYVAPYNNPWYWMNRQAVFYTDEVLSVLIEQHQLSRDIPIVPTGYSMGGLAALVYSKYTAFHPVPCVANCPVCDLVYHFAERDDVPRTLYSAFFHYDMPFENGVSAASCFRNAGNRLSYLPLLF